MNQGRRDLLVFRNRARPRVLRCPVGLEHRLQTTHPIGIQASGLRPDKNTSLLRRGCRSLIIIQIPRRILPTRNTIQHETLICGGGRHCCIGFNMGGLPQFYRREARRDLRGAGAAGAAVARERELARFVKKIFEPRTR